MTPQRPSTTPRRKKYGRNSSDEQHKMATITSQQAAVDEWDRAHGGDPQPGDWYVDEGWSGFTLDRPDLRDVASRAGVHVDPAWGPGKIVLELYERLVEPELFDPTFVKDFPREVSPLARPHRDVPGFTEQFDLVIAGTEIGPAYSELTDPNEQRARFEMQQAARRTGDEEAHPYDEDFVQALEHGLAIVLGSTRLIRFDAHTLLGNNAQHVNRRWQSGRCRQSDVLGHLAFAIRGFRIARQCDRVAKLALRTTRPC